MAKIAYTQKNFGAKSLIVIDQANLIINDFAAKGMDLTLRQLYYQFVALGEEGMANLGFPVVDGTRNNMRSYKRLGGIVNDARMAGHIDWNSIIDRTRNLNKLNTFSDPGEIIDNCVYWFRLDRWADQPNYLEVWIEKEALIGVIQQPAQSNHVPFYACKGYVSQSEMWRAGAGRIADKIYNKDQDAIIIHLGDHDPSGIDMARDIEDRFRTFLPRGCSSRFKIHRIALNMDQVELYNPPPNPAKLSDSRASDYVSAYGTESWELDALDPLMMRSLIEDTIESYKDQDAWTKTVEKENEYKATLRHLASTWDDDCPECGAER